MKVCCIIGCKSQSGRDKISFHKFPTDPTLRNAWLCSIKRKGWTPTKYSHVCAKHFKDKLIIQKNERVFLDQNAVPTLFSTHRIVHKISVRPVQQAENVPTYEDIECYQDADINVDENKNFAKGVGRSDNAIDSTDKNKTIDKSVTENSIEYFHENGYMCENKNLKEAIHKNSTKIFNENNNIICKDPISEEFLDLNSMESVHKNTNDMSESHILEDTMDINSTLSVYNIQIFEESSDQSIIESAHENSSDIYKNQIPEVSICENSTKSVCENTNDAYENQVVEESVEEICKESANENIIDEIMVEKKNSKNFNYNTVAEKENSQEFSSENGNNGDSMQTPLPTVYRIIDGTTETKEFFENQLKGVKAGNNKYKSRIKNLQQKRRRLNNRIAKLENFVSCYKVNHMLSDECLKRLNSIPALDNEILTLQLSEHSLPAAKLLSECNSDLSDVDVESLSSSDTD